MEKEADFIQREEIKADGTIGSYLVGFILSLILTFVAYFIVSDHLLKEWTLIMTLSGLALAQALVQLIFFLHLGSKSTPSWNVAAFLFMLIVTFIIVAGSLWIMYHLDYNMGMEGMEQKLPLEGL